MRAILIALAFGCAVFWSSCVHGHTNLTREAAATRYKTRSLDSSSSNLLDERVLATILELKDISVTKTEVLWGDAAKSAMGFSWGIVLSRFQLEDYRQLFGETNFSRVLLFVLAHELAHCIVALDYSDSQFKSLPVRVRELQADILATQVITWWGIRERSRGITNVTLIGDGEGSNLWLRVSTKIGEDHPRQSPARTNLNGYPSREQRAEAMSVGLVGGWHEYDFRLLQKYQRSQVTDRSEKVRQRMLKARETQPGLPMVNFDKMNFEKRLVWSERVARLIAQGRLNIDENQ